MKYFKDSEFIRGNCPMTKEEIRIFSTIKLNLENNYRVLDVGAGTGSVSIQICKICSLGEVLAIEKGSDALEVIYKNKEKFNCENLTIIPGEALEVEGNIQGEFDAIFIGGSGGNIDSIIKTYGSKLKNGRNMVLNFITIDNVYKAMETLKVLNYEVECIQLSVSKTKEKSYMLMANNPIFIVTAVKDKEGEKQDS